MLQSQTRTRLLSCFCNATSLQRNIFIWRLDLWQKIQDLMMVSSFYLLPYKIIFINKLLWITNRSNWKEKSFMNSKKNWSSPQNWHTTWCNWNGYVSNMSEKHQCIILTTIFGANTRQGLWMEWEWNFALTICELFWRSCHLWSSYFHQSTTQWCQDRRYS